MIIDKISNNENLLHKISRLIVSDLSVKEAADFIHAHPTLSEAVGEALMSASGKGLH